MSPCSRAPAVPKEIHAARPENHAGNGSWDLIMPYVQKLWAKRHGKNYYMRGTFTHANPYFLKDIKYP